MKRYEAFITKDWRNTGLASVAVARTDDDGGAALGFFLVDPLCLGVKDTFSLDDLTESELNEIIEERFPEGTMERMHPAWAKKFIEGAVAYAERLGFNPHRDYRKTRRVLAGIDESVCTETFTYGGDDGRPHYVQGGDDDDERVNRVTAVLDARLGPGGYSVTTREDVLSDPDISDEAIAKTREMLDRALKKMKSEYNSHVIAGLLTALLCRPDVYTVDDAMDMFANDVDTDGNPYEQHHLVTLNRLLELYWSQLDSLLELTLEDAEDADDKPWPFDFYADDFPDDEMFLRALLHWMSGFTTIVTVFKDIWSEALERPELADHWKLVDRWGNPDNPDGLLAKLQNADAAGKAGEDKDKSVHNALEDPRSSPPVAIVAIYRALRPDLID